LLTKCDDGVWIVDTLALGRPGVVAAYIIRGKESALIDMGYASSVPTVLEAIQESSLSSGGIDYLLPTHVHLDHAGACGELAQVYPNASIRVHPKGEPHLVDPSRLWGGVRELFGGELAKLYGKPQRIESSRVKPIGDGEEINLGNGLSLRSVWTPGHASHHLSYYLERGDVFTGDAVGITYPAFPTLIPTTPPTSFNLESAVESLLRIGKLSPKRFFTPHYGIVENAQHSIDTNIRSLRDWGSRVEAMLQSGISIEEMTSTLTQRIATLDRSLRPMPDYAQMSIRISVFGMVRYLRYQMNR